MDTVNSLPAAVLSVSGAPVLTSGFGLALWLIIGLGSILALVLTGVLMARSNRFALTVGAGTFGLTVLLALGFGALASQADSPGSHSEPRAIASAQSIV